MTAPVSQSGRGTSADAAFAELVEELTARLHGGEPFDVEAYLGTYPEHAARLRELLPALQMLAELSESGSGGAVAAGSLPDGSPTGTLGDFRLIREVGRGGMGVVYEAEQISLGRRVALKVLPFAATIDPRHLQRFHNEARAAASLHHEHIVPVYAVGCEHAVHFYAMQFIEGHSLAQLIAAQDSASGASAPPAAAATAPVAGAPTEAAPRDAAYFRRVAEWGVQAAEALEYAHALGIVHRDVKPGNLLVDGGGKLWVTDFGLARLGTDSGLTMTGDVLGTLRYMSPEQALAKHGLVDHRTDVYGLGATLYELLTSRPAIDGKDREEILRNIAFEEPTPPRKIERNLPADLEVITLKALAKEPAERYVTAKELADDLRRWLEDRPVRARRPRPLVRLQKWSRRHTALVRAVGLGLVVAVAALSVSTVWAWHKQNETDEQHGAAVRSAAQADEQRQRATENYRKSVKVLTALLENMSGKQSSLTAEQVSLASEAAVVIQELLAGDAPTDPESRLLTALAREGLGTARLARGEVFEAAQQYALARDLCAQLAAEFPGEDRYQHEKVRIHDRLRRLRPLQLAQGTADAGMHEVAARAFRDCVRIDQIAGSEFDGHMTLDEQTWCRLRLAETLRALGQRPEAEQAYGETLADYDRLAQYPATKVWPPLVMAKQSRALAGRGLMEAEDGRLEQAEADFRQALALVDGLKPHEQELALMVLHDRARVRSALGNVLWAQGQREKATEQFRRAAEEWRRAKSEPVRDNDLAWFLATCPDVQFRDDKEAVKLAQQAVAKTPEKEPWRALGVTDYSPWHYRRALGVALYRAGDWQRAAEAFEAVRKLRQGYYHPIVQMPEDFPGLEKEPSLPRRRAMEDDSITDGFFLAMIEWQQGKKEAARSRDGPYHSAAFFMKRDRPGDEELRRFRDEAAQLLGIEADYD